MFQKRGASQKWVEKTEGREGGCVTQRNYGFSKLYRSPVTGFTLFELFEHL